MKVSPLAFVAAFVLVTCCAEAQPLKSPGAFRHPFGSPNSASPQQNPSPSPPEATPYDALTQAVTPLMQQGRLQEVQSHLQEADRARGKDLKVVDSQRADIVYASAICFMLQKDYAQARTTLDRLEPMRSWERDFVLNRAKVDLADRSSCMRAARLLDVYLTWECIPDEDALNLFGAAIDEAEHADVSDTPLDSLIQDYLKFNGQLELTRPGMHHWGQTWISDDDFKPIQNQQEDAKRRIDPAKADLDRAEQALDAAKSSYGDAARMSAENKLAGRFDTGSTIAADSRIQAAQNQVASCEAALKAVRAKMPHPTWNPDTAPTIPDRLSWLRCGTASEQGPSLTLADAIGRMTSEAGPGANHAWRKLNIDLAQQWLEKHVAGNRISISGSFAGGELRADGVLVIRFKTAPIEVNGLSVGPSELEAELASSGASTMAKLVEGDAVTVTGSAENVALSGSADNPAKAQIEIRLTSASLRI